MGKTRALGKGLSSLIPHGDYITDSFPEGSVKTLRVDQLHPNPYQPRKQMDPASLKILSDSIREHGVIQPVLVRNAPSGYEIVAGERRWRASQLAGLSEIPVHILELSDNQAMELALVENLQREDLNPLEIAQGINELIKKFSFTHEQVASKLGWSRAAVTNKLRLLQLPEEVRQHLVMGTLTEGHARTILSLPTPDAVVAMAQLAIDEGLNVRQLEELVRSYGDSVDDDFVEDKSQNGSDEDYEKPKSSLLPISPTFSKICRKNKVKVRLSEDKKGTKLVLHGFQLWQTNLIMELIEKAIPDLFPTK